MFSALNHQILQNKVMKSLFILPLMTIATSSFATNWSITSQSNVGFYIQSMGVKVVKGRFNQVQSNFNLDPKAIQNAQANFTMNVNSLSLSKLSMMNMMMGKDLFYAEKYKIVTFKSSQFKPLGQNKYAVSGQLTLRGVTRPVVFTTTLTPTNDKSLMAIHSSTQIDRSDFGMKPAIGGIGEKVNLVVDGQIRSK